MATVTMSEAIFAALMLLLIISVFIWACKPWRFFTSFSHHHHHPPAEDLERPLISDDLDRVESQRDELTGNVDLEESRIQIDVPINSSGGHGPVSKQRLPPAEATQGVSLVLDVISESLEDSLVGQTLKRPLGTNRWLDGNRSAKKEGYKYESTAQSFDNSQESVPKANAYQRSSLILEVISGPSRGSRCSLQSTDTSRLPLTLGRVSPSDLLLKDGEVSGKHAMINWNPNKLKWELVDLGSLNGTLLNSMSVHNPDSGSRHWSEPIELSNGDIITLGTTSKITVQLTHAETEIPFGVAMASDPMSFRRGGKKLPMEDVCYYQWPLQGVEQFGVFGICDGHGGAEAAKAASKMLPEMIANILSISENRKRVLSHGDASDVLRNAFTQTESAMRHHQYEGCTATVLLVWADGEEDFCAQCANVGDSACLVNVSGRQIKMTEDHRITSLSERNRLNATGEPLKDGETRLCGLNLARMLGDKFLKEQEPRFSSEPYISQVVHIDKKSNAFALLASDGLWDVISVKKAMQLVLETRDRYGTDKGNMAEKIANSILSEARNLRTKDNTSIVLLDFNNHNDNNTSRTTLL